MRRFYLKNMFFLIVLSLFLAGCSPINRDCIAVCGDGEVRIIDLSKSDGKDVTEVWKWSKDDSLTILPEGYDKYMRNVDECKFVDNNTKLLLTASGGGMMLLDIKTKEILCYAHVPMAHSADFLPEGRIAVALSTHKKGNALEVYDMDTPEQVIFRDTLYSGHGVVWNEKYQSLFALGYKELREYKLEEWNTDTPSLKRVGTWEIPLSSGHDLSFVDNDRMLVSAHEGVVWFDIDKKSFTPFEPLKDTENVKSVNYDPVTSHLIYTKAEIRWWTHNIYQCNPDKIVTIDSLNIYKVRKCK